MACVFLDMGFQLPRACVWRHPKTSLWFRFHRTARGWVIQGGGAGSNLFFVRHYVDVGILAEVQW